MPPTEFYTYEPRSGHGLLHDPFNAIIGPRPIGWISSLSPAGIRNLAPYSFFNAFNYTPPMLGFSSAGFKHTIANVSHGREFVWNLVTRELAEKMNTTSASVAAEVDEFALAGLTGTASTLVKPPRVAESRVAMECKLCDCIQLKTASGEKVESWLVVGEVVMVHIDRTLLTKEGYDTAAAHPILRAGGPDAYAEITPDRMFAMLRPK